ncbi:hemolymph lipopolysaccharide-binding protein-like [Schistocerca piceifrons]|uniref:hemolymph lipopolysaccharide-binding protein-like n=1 Tax=Schistocerca piceifrons TaxID=274613 RepID=UPI001F5FA997|nr:hemolymph lipopolysaccharide-binding protein-like [Schistocerca piceifrons]
MASTAFVLNAGVIALALTVGIPIFPTLADQTPGTAETTYPYGNAAIIVKTTVTCSPDHDGHKAGVCSKYDVEVTNHIKIAHHSQETEAVTTEVPTLRSNACNNDTVATTGTPRDVRAGYTKYDGVGYYKVPQLRATWSEAKSICEEDGGHMVIINSKEEEEVIRKVICGQILARVGFRYEPQKGYYETVLGEPLDSVGYIHWDESAGPPSMEGECGAVWEATGKVRNIRCKVPLPFVCELPA